MNVFILALLLSVPAPETSPYRSPMPGPDAAAAFGHGKEGLETACAAFVEHLRGKSDDPWSYLGAVYCVAELPETRETIFTALDELPADSPLVLFARGFMSFREGNVEDASTLLHRAVELQPDFAFTWNVLGEIKMDQNDVHGAIDLFEKALAFAPGLPHAARNLEIAQYYIGALDRILKMLTEIPERWDEMPEPRVPMSGRLPGDVIDEASLRERGIAIEFLEEFHAAPFNERAGLIARRVEEREFREVDVWLPLYIAERKILQDQQRAALDCEFALMLAQALGRRDQLLYGAGMILAMMPGTVGVASAHDILGALVNLPMTPGAEIGMGQVYIAYAESLYNSGDPRASLVYYQKAQRIFESTGNKAGITNALQGEADVFYILGDLENALAAYQQSGEIAREAGHRQGHANSLTSAAGILLRVGRLEESLAAEREAREIFRAFGDYGGEARTLTGESEVLLLLGDLEEAVSVCREARRLLGLTSDKIDLAGAFFCEGRGLSRLGRIEAGLSAYQQAYQLYQASGYKIGMGNALKGEAELFHDLGENEKALYLYQEARRLSQEAGERVGEGNALYGEATVLRSLDGKRALVAFREARSLYQAIQESVGDANSLFGEAMVLDSLGQGDAALTAYRQAHQMFKDFGHQLGQGNTLYGEATLHFQRDDFEEAASAAASAASLFREMDNATGEINALLLEGKSRIRLGDVATIRGLAERALALHAAVRREYVAEEHRTDVDLNVNEAYNLLLTLLSFEQEQREDALALAEQARSQVLLDLMTGGMPQKNNVPEDLLSNEKRLLAELAEVGRSLRNDVSELAHRYELLTRRRVLDAELQRNLYDQASARQRESQFGQPLSTDEIRALAREVGPILLYYVAEVRVVSFLVLPSGEIHMYSVDVPRAKLRDEVDRFIFDISNPMLKKRVQQAASVYWEKFISPFADQLPESGPLTIIPHGPLHDLPYAALIDPSSGRPLFEKWHVAVSPSASVLAFNRRERHRDASESDRLVAFAAGTGIHFSEADVDAVAGLFPGSRQITFSRAEAEFNFYVEHAPQARHVLIASNGVHTENSRRGTYLEIQPTPGVHDERLTAAEIATIPLNAELVTLAACDTDRGDALLSDERLTLTRSFLIAGAASVLATRWRIPDDRSTTRFLVDFYQAYRKGGPDGKGMRKDEALTSARRKSVQRGDPAQVWAAWVLVGDAR